VIVVPLERTERALVRRAMGDPHTSLRILLGHTRPLAIQGLAHAPPSRERLPVVARRALRELKVHTDGVSPAAAQLLGAEGVRVVCEHAVLGAGEARADACDARVHFSFHYAAYRLAVVAALSEVCASDVAKAGHRRALASSVDASGVLADRRVAVEHRTATLGIIFA
jgi:hypothetical protein